LTVTTLETLRAYSLNRSLKVAPSVEAAIEGLGFLQADPIRAPARAQDLILRQRVTGYRAGDLERLYPELGIEEEFFVNYGFVTRAVQAIMHPRHLQHALKIELEAPGLSEQVLEFVRENGETHPKALEKHFGKMQSDNYWGGTSQATTRVLDALHYKGKLRVARRVGGVKVYAPAPHLELLETPASNAAQIRALVRLIVQIYAPLPLQSLGHLTSLVGYGAPHLKTEVKRDLKRLVRDDLQSVTVEGMTYVYPQSETLEATIPNSVKLLAPFDPVVWDRRRFAHLHGWEYRFEAYTPAAKRTMGYYALPLLWEDRAIGWANLKVVGGDLETELGFVGREPKSKAFKGALNAELEAMRVFLGLS
jgi:uncharacterized protein